MDKTSTQGQIAEIKKTLGQLSRNDHRNYSLGIRDGLQAAVLICEESGFELSKNKTYDQFLQFLDHEFSDEKPE